jgi:arylsulfatase A-like enzyme
MTDDNALDRERRRFLQSALAAPTAVATLNAAAAADDEVTALRPGSRPNLIFILADDLGSSDLSSYGHPSIRTPRLDAFAREGTRLTQAYSNSAVCTPTRVGFFTGRYQQRLPIGLEEPLAYVGQLTPEQRATLGIPPSHPTVPSLLAAAGYATALIGKWHAGYLPNFSPIKSGFSEFYGVFSGGVDYFTHADNNGSPDLWDGETSIDNQGYITQLLSRRAQRFIERHASARRPFYLSLHFTSPHWPWEGPKDGARAGTFGSLFDFSGGSLEVYRAMVENLDSEIGRVLDTVRAAGLERDTLVVFTSDNGGERYSHMWPFTGAKGSLNEGGIRVPAIVRWPGVVRRRTNAQVAVTMDWAATLLAAAGAVPNAAYPLDGEDLLPVLAGLQPPRPRALFWRMRTQAAARIGDLKYLRTGSAESLFDLAADVHEQANLAPSRPEDLAALRLRYEGWNSQMLPRS